MILSCASEAIDGLASYSKKFTLAVLVLEVKRGSECIGNFPPHPIHVDANRRSQVDIKLEL